VRLARRPALWGGALCAAVWVVTLTVRPWSDERVSDLGYLSSFAAAFLHGHLPYSDVAFEYPPLAAPVVALPGVFGTDHDAYRLALAALMLACAVAVVWACARLARATGGSERIAVAVVALAPLLLGAVTRNHFDLAAVALIVWALVALVEGRPRLGLALLGAGALTKVFPLAAAPVALAWLAARGRGRMLAPAVALAAVAGAGAAVAVALSPSGALHVLRYHFDRPPQIESTPAVALLALDALGWHTTSVVSSFGSQGVSGYAARVLAGGLAVVGIATVALLAARAYARPSARGLVLGSLGAVAAFAAFGKVLSPQFATWLIPLLALALAWREWLLAAVTAGAMALTFLEFPFRYFDLVGKAPGAVALVAARDVAMLAVVGLCVTRVPPAAPARYPWHARRRPPPPPRPSATDPRPRSRT
jgi:uncharacterized membrane protein